MQVPTSPADAPPRRRRWWLAGVGAAAIAATLTVTTVAFAATLFSDDFQDGNASGWSTNGGSWSVVTDGTLAYRQTSTSSTARSLAGSTSWTSYSVQARVRPIAFNGADRYAALLARVQNNTNNYYLALRNSGRVELGKTVGGGLTALGSAGTAVITGTWYTLRLDVSGSNLRAYLNNALVVSATDATFSAGRVGFSTFNTSASFDDILVSDTIVAPPTPSNAPSTGGPTTGPPAPPQTGLVGFAAVNSLGQNGTTGGAGGPTVTVSNAADFISYAQRPGAYTIRVSGVIALSGMTDVTSDKTIVGVGASSGFTGFGLNVGLPVSDAITSVPANAVHNVIIRNLVFTNSGDDAINVQMFSHHIWIDHNDLCCSFDGLVDIKRGSSFLTVSWNHTHNHTKNMLLGHDDGAAAQDVGNLKVSYHHNWYDQTPQRNPRVRFGEPVHVFSNYYLHNTDIGVACQANAGCVVEGNYFENTEETVSNHYAGPTGRCVARNNVLVGESNPADCSGTVQEPRTYYSYTLDNPNDVKAIVMAGAGTGKI